MGAEWTETHFPTSKPQAHFSSSATDWNAGSEQLLFFAHLWTLLQALVGKGECEVSTGKDPRDGGTEEYIPLPYRNCFGAGATKAFWFTRSIPEITLSPHFSEKGSRKLSIAELSLNSLMTDALAKTTSIILSHELHLVLVQNHIPSGNSLEELLQ